MAISSIDTIRNKNQTKSSCSTNVFNGSNVSSQLKNLNITATKCSITSANKYREPMKSNSFYFGGDRGQFSRIIEKRFIHKLGTDYVSSFPLSARIYKANSGERLTKRNNKTVKKSVLTLPNEPLVRPESCTVSDMNDSEYFYLDNDHKHKTRKKPSTNKSPRKHKDEFEFYNREDVRHCLQRNINLDCSSSDLITDYNGDGRPNPKQTHFVNNSQAKSSVNPRDVWAVLRNINQFQFRPSPPISDDNNPSPKNIRPLNKKRKHHKNTRVIETSRRKEFAYLSNFEVTSRSNTNFSQSSSFDRITVLNKDGEFTKIYNEFEKRISETQKFKKGAGNAKADNRIKTTNTNNKKLIKSNFKAKENKTRPKPKQQIPLSLTEKNVIDIKKCTDSRKEMNYNRYEALNANKGTSFNGTIKTYSSDQLSLSIKIGDQIKENRNKVNPCRDCNETLCFGYSGSNKADLQNFVCKNIYKKEKVKLVKVSLEAPSQEVKEITQIAFSKPQDIISHKVALGYRKPRLLMTIPSNVITPKLTLTEIKRRLANMKFPIIILGKDQLSSSSIQVESFDGFQFNGLDKQVWPFMVDWYDDKVFSNGKNNMKMKYKNDSERKITKGNTIHSDLINLTKGRKLNNTYNSITKKKMESKGMVACIESNNKQSQQVKKQKPKGQFKSKVLQLLYKKSCIGNKLIDDEDNEHNVDGKSDIKKQMHTEITKTSEIVNAGKKDASTEPYHELNQRQDVSKDLSVQSRKITMVRHPWGKVKLASDFIDNVIKKINSGVYYNGENIMNLYKTHDKESRETSIQTNFCMTLKAFDDNIIDENKLTSGVMVNNKEDRLKTISGFDDALQKVKIKTLNMKQIAVKHCLTNIMIQFDVAIQKGPEYDIFSSEKASSFVPLTTSNSHTQIFKCKMTLLNPVLPAQLCYILPKIMHSIIKSNTNNSLALAHTLEEKNETQLSITAELTPCNLICKSNNLLFPPTSHIIRSRNLIEMSKGTFSDSIKNKSLYEERTMVLKYCSYNIGGIFTKVDMIHLMILCNVNLDLIATISEQKCCIIPEQKSQSCTAIQPYVTSKQSLIPTMMANCYMNNLQKLLRNVIVIQLDPSIYPEYTNSRQLSVYNKSYRLDNNAMEKTLSLSVSNLKMDLLFNNIIKLNRMTISTFLRNSEVNSSKWITKVKSYKTEKKYLHNLGSNFNTNKKKSFITPSKCKSTTSISRAGTSTSLNKIINLEDFCEALGSGKFLSKVFEGYAEKKILASIVEMKNWITEISQRQAMLVLLLTNKKETLNLVSFRPILLQGIAVNRITRASELDMEIEVIERENINKRYQYESISYITSSEQTKDNLLEELYWIAKTTASDYQKQFDESSERLLKSLLEKRKKLNPSYLRVMARYVGLGLLKSPSKIN